MSKRSIRRAEQRRSRRQNQLLIIGGIVAAAVLAVVLLIVLGNASNPTAKIDTARYQGIPQELDRSGAPGLALGSKDAKTTLVEYGDFSCPHCRDMAETVHQLIDPYVRTGKLRIIYKPVWFINPQLSPAATRAVLCGAEQGKGWEMQDQVWGVYDTNTPNGYSMGIFASRAAALGLDGGKFQACYDASETTSALTALQNEADQKGVTSTPTIYLNGTLISAAPADVISQVQLAVGQ